MPEPSRRAGIRSRLLLIALAPALLTALGLTAYFTRLMYDVSGAEMQNRAASAARHAAQALPYALVSGNVALIQRIADEERHNSQLAFLKVDAVDPALRALSGKRPGNQENYVSWKSAIVLPSAELGEDASPAADSPRLGMIEAGVALDQAERTRRESLLRTALAALGALIGTGLLAWRLSTRLASQINHIGSTVGQLAHGDFRVRVVTRHDAEDEITQLGEGVNVMAEALQRHQAELEQRIAQATADLAAKKDQAERANAAKSRFFAAASHDLRQPMHALSLFVAALKARPLPPDAQQLADQIEASTGAMELMFNALLDISKLDAGVIEAQPQHFAIQPLLDSLTRQFGPVAAEKGLRLRVTASSAYLHSDPILIERILVNLVSNAVRYTETGGVLVGCRHHGGLLRLVVCDTGPGVPPDQQENIFQEFVQLDNPARDRDKGLGLGLAIVSRLGRLLGHRIQLDSTPGKGSAFSIEIPLGDPALVRPSAPPAPAPGVLPADALVVLIDDETAILDGMVELFRNWKIDLVAVHDAAEARARLAELDRRPDVIVSDYRLPGEDGLAVISGLRERYGAALPAVIISGDTAPETIQTITAAGLSVLHKPLRPAKLRALISHQIRIARGGQ